MNGRRRQPGFALLLALVLVLLAGVALASVARRSTHAALAAHNAEDQLKRNWAVASISATLLPHAERLLDDAELGVAFEESEPGVYLNDPTPRRRISCRLAGIDYDLLITDEQAKVNLNRMLRMTSRSETEAAAGRLVRSAATTGRLEMRLRPMSGVAAPPTRGRAPEKIGGFGQVFASPDPRQLVGVDRRPGATSRITLWGDGKLNFRRADADTIEAFCTEPLGPAMVKDLLEARRDDAHLRLAAALRQIEVEPEERARVERYLTDYSLCHGIWVVARGPQRSWYTLVIGESKLPEFTGVVAEIAQGEDRFERLRMQRLYVRRQLVDVHEVTW